jgi:chromate reductase
MTNILAISGSLRHGSINQCLLAKLAGRAPAEASFQLFEGLRDVPLFNEDLEAPSAPAGVSRLWRAVAEADVLLIATPEYNQSLPGVVKNLVDWLSRDPGRGLRGKLCAVTGATVGRWGTRIAQQQLRTVLATCGARVLGGPALYVADGSNAEPAAEELDAYLGALLAEVSPIRLAA